MAEPVVERAEAQQEGGGAAEQRRALAPRRAEPARQREHRYEVDEPELREHEVETEASGRRQVGGGFDEAMMVLVEGPRPGEQAAQGLEQPSVRGRAEPAVGERFGG